jgi:hypothetical protein
VAMNIHASPPGRALRSTLWLALNLALAAITALLLGFLASPAMVAVGLVLVLGLAVAGAVIPALTWLAFQAWHRLYRYTAAISYHWVLLLLYGCLSLVGMAGSRLEMARPRLGSTWKPFGAGLGMQTEEIATGGSSIRQTLRWALNSGNAWVLPLVPFMLLAARIRPDEAGAEPSATIYTLY